MYKKYFLFYITFTLLCTPFGVYQNSFCMNNNIGNTMDNSNDNSSDNLKIFEILESYKLKPKEKIEELNKLLETQKIDINKIAESGENKGLTPLDAALKLHPDPSCACIILDHGAEVKQSHINNLDLIYIYYENKYNLKNALNSHKKYHETPKENKLKFIYQYKQTSPIFFQKLIKNYFCVSLKNFGEYEMELFTDKNTNTSSKQKCKFLDFLDSLNFFKKNKPESKDKINLLKIYKDKETDWKAFLGVSSKDLGFYDFIEQVAIINHFYYQVLREKESKKLFAKADFFSKLKSNKAQKFKDIKFETK